MEPGRMIKLSDSYNDGETLTCVAAVVVVKDKTPDIATRNIDYWLGRHVFDEQMRAMNDNARNCGD